MQKVHAYLKEIKSAAEIYKQNIDEPMNICIGNVSCDMDSAIGAIILAYYKTYKSDYFEEYGNYENLWIPVINCPRAEIKARIDICYHLESFNINHEDLIYNDDIDINFYADNKLLNLALIDHNKLDMTQSRWESSIRHIVDHHLDNKTSMDVERIVKFCGSACSLVVNMIFESGLGNQILDKDICRFFWPAILLDTENFNPDIKGKKWCEVDETAFAQMSRMILTEQYHALFQHKFDKKLNIELGLDLILRKDYKNFEWKNCNCGISVVFNPIHEILVTFGVKKVHEILAERMKDLNLGLHIIISQTYDNSGHALREIMIFHEEQNKLEMVSKAFEAETTFPIQKKKFTGLAKNFSFYKFKDESVSRKKVDPIFNAIFQKFEKF